MSVPYYRQLIGILETLNPPQMTISATEAVLCKALTKAASLYTMMHDQLVAAGSPCVPFWPKYVIWGALDRPHGMSHRVGPIASLSSAASPMYQWS